MKFSYNPHGCNKEWDYKILTTGFNDTTGTPQDLADIVAKGFAINGAWFGGKPRSKANVVYNGLICLDFDNTLLRNGKKIYNPQMAWEEAINHPFLKDYAALAYTSPSYRDDWHKLRVVIPLPDGIDNDIYSELYRWVSSQVPGCDPACKDAGRVFFGNNKAKFHHYHPTKEISLEIINECREKARVQQERLKLERENQLKWLESQNPEKNKQLGLEALRLIPPRGNKGDGRYSECLQTAFALCDLFGHEALAVVENWSPTDKKNEWYPEKILRDYRGDIKAGTLFYIAQSYGFSFPERKNWVDPRDPKGPEYDDYERYLEQEAKTDAAIANEKKQNRFQKWLSKILAPKSKRNRVRIEKHQQEKILRIKNGKGLPSPEKYKKLDQPTIIISPGMDRIKLLEEANEKGFKYILEGSFMGSGKSHCVPDIKNPDGKIFYISDKHRNPSIKGIEKEFTDFIPRTKYGFIQKDGKLVEADEDTPKKDLVIKPNCPRADIFKKCYQTNNSIFTTEITEIKGELALVSNKICAACPLLNQCRHIEGMYLHDANKTLEAKKIRLDSNSCLRSQEENNHTLIVDELSSLRPSKKIFSNPDKLTLELEKLRDYHIDRIEKDFENKKDNIMANFWSAKAKNDIPSILATKESGEEAKAKYEKDIEILEEMYTYIKSYPLETLKKLTKENQPKYGFETEAILKGIKTHEKLAEWINFLQIYPIDLKDYFTEADIIQSKELSKLSKEISQIKGQIKKLQSEVINISEKNRKKEIEKEVQSLKEKIIKLTEERKSIKSANSYLKKEALKNTFNKLETLPDNAWILLLKMINGEDIQVRLKGSKLDITIENRFYTSIFEKSKSTIILDATASLKKVQMSTGIEDWLIIRQDIKNPLANLTINQIETEGLGSNNPSQKALERVGYLIETLEPEATLGFKKHLEALNLDGYWFKDNIGSNAYKGIESVSFIGNPSPNIGQIKDEYLALGADIENFDLYYQSLIDEQILQACGRQRCQHFPDKKFTINWIGTNLDLDFLKIHGATINKISAYEINPLAGTETQIIKLSYLEAATAAAKDGIKFTQTAIAQKLLEAKNIIGKAQSTISENLSRWGISTSDLKNLALKIIGSPIEDIYRRSDILEDPDFRAFMGLEQILDIAQTLEVIALMSWEDIKAIILDFGEKPMQLEALRLLLSIFDETDPKSPPHPK